MALRRRLSTGLLVSDVVKVQYYQLRKSITPKGVYVKSAQADNHHGLFQSNIICNARMRRRAGIAVLTDEHTTLERKQAAMNL
jgi:hypothetical protein